MTSHAPPSTWFPLSMGCTLVILSILGCGKTDLSEYRPAGHDETINSVPSDRDEHPSDAAGNATDADSQTPITAQLESDSELTTETQGAPKDVVSTPATESTLDISPASALVPVNVVSSVRELMSIPTSNPAKIDDDDSSVPSAPREVTTTKQVQIEDKKNQIEILIKEKKFQTESKTGALRVSFDDLDLLKVLNMEPVVENAVELMPDWLKSLDGKPVRIRGFMYPTYETEGIERFVLARDNQICCFGRDPKIYDLVQVDMKEGKSTNYIPATRAFDVVGTLRIKMVAPEGTPYGLYFIEQATVIDR